MARAYIDLRGQSVVVAAAFLMLGCGSGGGTPGGGSGGATTGTGGAGTGGASPTGSGGATGTGGTEGTGGTVGSGGASVDAPVDMTVMDAPKEAAAEVPSGPFALTSTAFTEGVEIPLMYKCDQGTPRGMNISPP